MLRDMMTKVLNNENLTELEMIDAMNSIMDGKESAVLLSSFLTGLRMKGETPSEITGAAKVMRKKAEKVSLDDIFKVDTCGTGGDNSGTFNISTAAAFVTAAAGIPVVKHGNRSVSSKTGSADVLEELGVSIDLLPEQVEKCVRTENIGFFFAPTFHKAMKNAIGVRKELGIRTIFNILGPLTNPSNAQAQVLGVFNRDLTEIVAQVLKNLGVKYALVVCGMDGLDELTVTTSTKVTELNLESIKTYYLNPADLGITPADKKELIGGDRKENAKIIKEIFEGKKGPKRDILLLNSGASIYASQRAGSIKEGIQIAQKVVDSGEAKNKLEAFIKYTNYLSTTKEKAI